MAIVNQKQVKAIFHEKDKRVPKGYLKALQSLVTGIVDQSALNGGTIRKEAVVQLAEKSSYITMARHVNQAYEQIKNTPKENTGNLFRVANQIAQKEGDQKGDPK